MDRYDNYNPEIPYTDSYSLTEDKPEIPAAEPQDKGKKPSDKKKESRKRTVPKVAKPRQKVERTPISIRIKDWATSFTTRCITGLILAGLGAWMLIAFISYLSNCFPDQSIINNTAVGEASGVANKAGEGGARLMEFLVNDCFGLGSVVIIFWLFAMSLKLLLGVPKFKSVNFTIKCLVALITVSLIVGLVTITSGSTVNWGGYHGRYVNQLVIDFIGWPGDLILCAVMVFIFVIICLSDFIRWINKIRAKNAARRQRIAEEKARRMEEQRIIEEMRDQERMDDLNAGLTAENTEDSTDEEDNIVSFNPDEANSIYENVGDIDEYEMSDDSLQMTTDYNMKEETEEYSSVDSSDNNVTDKYREAGTDVENEDSEGDNTLNDVNVEGTESDREGDSMIVNVNQISSVSEVKDRRSEFYKFPPLDILRKGDDKIDVNAEEQLRNKEKIRQTLADFGITIISIEATVGPTVTLYEIRPDKGQKVANIKKLVDDISLQLAATGVRIIAPIPGKGTVGIEVANRDAKVVSMRTVIGSRKYNESKFKLPVALGCTISNEVYIADLTKMPHLLVAGATGQGKSVGLNAIIASLLYRKKPHELKFVMIDPKMVEFSLYSKIEDHYLAKLPGEDKAIITDMNKAVATLNSLVQEMEDRYSLLMTAGCRKVEEYNEKFLSGKLSTSDGHRYMPYIVVIIDEFADLIMSQKDVEKPIARLAQKARAVGIHEIIATQRPSTTVITGNIKANFLTRIAFKVSSGIDSKTILDTTGAQQLIGRGDMLINFNSEMTRVQCAFIDTPEVEELTDYISRQPYSSGPYILPEPNNLGDSDAGPTEMNGAGSIGSDPKFLEVATYIVQTGYASTSNIQRRFRLGYNRAGSLMDQLESLGVVGPASGGKPRQVLMSPSEAMDIINNAFYQ